MLRLLHGDFGRSFVFGLPVLPLIAARLPATLELTLSALLFATLLGVPLGIYAGTRPRSLATAAIMTVSIIGFSVPVFWVGLMLILAFAVGLDWLPAGGRGATVTVLGTDWSFLTLDGLRHLLLPALSLSLFRLSLITRLAAASTREVMLTEIVRFARGIGLSEATILRRHVLKLIAIPLVTVIGLEFGATMTFAVVTETIFSWPGLGKLIIDSIQSLDRPVMVAYLVLVAVLFVAINLIVDLAYAALDPQAADPQPMKREQKLALFWAEYRESPVAVAALVVVCWQSLRRCWRHGSRRRTPTTSPTSRCPTPAARPALSATDGMRHILGTNSQGRDLFSAILFGLRISLEMGLVAGLVALAIGTVLGVAAAYRGGMLASFVMRVVDLQLAFPAMLLALVVVALLGPGKGQMIAALIAAQYAYYARTAFGAASVEMRKDYIEAAAATPLSGARIVLRHLLPNSLPPLIVVCTVQVGSAIGLEATLSFLGVGLPTTEPSLGTLIANGFVYMMSGRYLDVGVSRHGADHRADRHQSGGRSVARKTQSAPETMTALLEVRDLATQFTTRAGIVRAVDGVSFSVAAGRNPGAGGRIRFRQKRDRALGDRADRSRRAASPADRCACAGRNWSGSARRRCGRYAARDIAMVFQDPMMALNPVLTIATQMRLAIAAHAGMSGRAARAHAVATLARVGIPDPAQRIDLYLHQFSGGMRQRVAIAMALLHRPALIIADEPTTALDVSVQAQILAEMRRIVDEFRTALIWISHDLAVVSALSDRIAVMYAGRIVEEGATADVLMRPLHPYTRGLLEFAAVAQPAGAGTGADRRIGDNLARARRLCLSRALHPGRQGVPGDAAVARGGRAPRALSSSGAAGMSEVLAGSGSGYKTVRVGPHRGPCSPCATYR